MKLKKIAALILVAVVLCVSAYAATVYDCISIGGTEDETSGAFTIESTETAPETASHWLIGKVTQYTESQAQEAGVPEGYSGEVWKVDAINAGDTSFGALIDFSASSIPVENVKSITFRVYVCSREHNSSTSLYMPKDGGWAVTYDIETDGNVDKWYEFTLSEKHGWRSGSGFSMFPNENGFFDKLNFGAVYAGGLYIDSIKIEYSTASIAPAESELRTGLTIYPDASSGYQNLTAPENYTGEVWTLAATDTGYSGANVGAHIDFSAMNLDAKDVESVTIRMSADSQLSQLYVKNSYTGSWVSRLTDDTSVAEWYGEYGAHRLDKWNAAKAATNSKTWYDFVVDEAALRPGYTVAEKMADANGKLCSIYLHTKGSYNIYIDSVTIQLKGGKTIDGEMLGAQVRTTGEKGLRFGTRIATNGDFTLDDVKFTAENDKLYAGTLVVSKEILDAAGIAAEELTHANMKAVDAVDSKAVNIFDSAYNTTDALYTSVVWDIPNETAEIVARGYIRYTADNGITYKYFYFDPVTKSMAAVNESAWGK